MVKKKTVSNMSLAEKRKAIDWEDSNINISKQCELLNLSKGGLYYQPVEISDYNLTLMEELDKQYMKTPFYGSRRMVAILNIKGYNVNRKRVQRLMRLMGIEAIYPKANLSKKNHEHKIYPYLLKNILIDRPNFVWSSDITYIKLSKGFVYLVAIIDWYSRYVLSWELSNSLSSEFCIKALEDALRKSKDKPSIFNTDQGSQFTCKDYVNIIEKNNIKMSMDGRGRALDNIFIERLWRSLKYENIYINDYKTVKDAYGGIRKYFYTYNTERPHQSLNYKIPYEVHPKLVGSKL